MDCAPLDRPVPVHDEFFGVDRRPAEQTVAALRSAVVGEVNRQLQATRRGLWA